MKRVVAAVAAVFCALMALLALHELRVEYRKRNAYKPTSCTVISRTIVEETPTTESSEHLGPEVTHYPVRVTVRFGYRVEGRDFVGEEARFFEKGEPAIAAHYDAHPPESGHDCWYDPERPGARAVLSNRVSSLGSFVMLGVGLVGAAGFGFVFRLLGAVGTRS
jgi:hypothetical protein